MQVEASWGVTLWEMAFPIERSYIYIRVHNSRKRMVERRVARRSGERTLGAGGRADLDRWDGAQGARSQAGAGAEPAVRRWVRERKMRLGWNWPAAVVPLDPEQALDLTVYIIIYVHTSVRTYVHVRGRSRTVLANERERKRTRTQINARKLIIAFDAWAISACKCDCILRIRSKTFRMYYRRL